jgi:cyclophilin family peptidyl-prolyl cis-trans isomerase
MNKGWGQVLNHHIVMIQDLTPFVLATALLAVVASAAPQATAPGKPAPKPAARPKPAPTPEPPLPAEAEIETDAGPITIKLLGELAPRHVRFFAKTAGAGGFDSTTFHRIIAGGIIQGGDPLSKDPKMASRYGTGGLGLLKAEFSDRPMTRGSVAAVLRPNQPDSGGHQFFICLSDQPSLTGKYTIFGEVTGGMEVADTIGQTPVTGDRANTRVEIKKVTLRP